MSALRVQRRVICVSPCSDSRSGHKAPDLGEGRGCLKAACAERCNNPPDYSPGELQGNLLPWKGIIPALLLPGDFFPFFLKREGSFSLNSCCSSPRELAAPRRHRSSHGWEGKDSSRPCRGLSPSPRPGGRGELEPGWEFEWSLQRLQCTEGAELLQGQSSLQRDKEGEG